MGNIGESNSDTGFETGTFVRTVLENTPEHKVEIKSEKDKILDKINNEVKGNSKEHIVSKGDTIYVIAKNNNLSVENLILFNSIIGKDFKIRKKSILIKAGDVVYIPKDIELFNNNLNKLQEVKNILNLNEKFTKENLDSLKIEANLYPKRVQSIGLPDLLDGFIEAQESEIDPRLSRIVDSGSETDVSCANLIRRLMAQSVNIADLKDLEKAFLRKQNLHAWILPTELMKIGYEQKFQDLMSFFDKGKIGEVNPIDNQKSYDKKVLELAEYLEKSGIPGSLVPYYFKLSSYKDDIADYNRGRKNEDKHLNTHQSMLAGNINLKFDAYKIKDYSIPEKILDFGNDREKTEKEIKELNLSLEKNKIGLQKIREKLITSTDLSNNEEIKKVNNYMNKGLSVLTGGNIQKIERIKIILLNIGDREKILSGVNDIVKRNYSKDDIDWLLALRQIYYKTYNSVNSIQQNASKNTQITNISGRVETNAEIVSNIKSYNTYLEKIPAIEKQIKSLKDSLQIERKINLVDYIANFIQQRLDYGSALEIESRNKIIDGIMKYNSMIHIKIDGVEINLNDEVEKYKNGKSSILVSPSSKIEISGPIMIDGEHQKHSNDKDRSLKMNARTRFFFEFIVPETYLATELLEPGEDSSFRKTEFGGVSDKFKVKGVYDVRKGETVEKALKEKIVIFEELDPKDPKYTSKLNYIYSQQIKALKIAGFLQDEQHLNPGAFKINRVIPYYDLENISEIFGTYIKDKKILTNNSNDELKNLKNFVPVHTFPGDTEYHVYKRLISNIKGINSDEFPNIKNIPDFNYFQQKNLIKTLLEGLYDKQGHIIPGKKIIISLVKINDISAKLSNETFSEAPKLKEIDNFVINNTTDIKQTQNLMKNIMYREKYGSHKDTYFAEIFGDTIGGFIDNTYPMSHKRNTAKYIAEIIDRTLLPTQIPIHATESVGEFGIRFLFIKDGWREWFNKNTMNKVFDRLESEAIKGRISSFSNDDQDKIREDYNLIKDLKLSVNRDNPSKYDFENMYQILRKIIRVNLVDSNSNYVGNTISGVFMEVKSNNHSEKLFGILNASGEKIDTKISSTEMKKYEKMIIYINNQGERNALYAFVQNFILRIMNEGMNANVQTSDVYDTSTKGELLGKIHYNKKVFMSHLDSYIRQLNNSELTSEQENIKNILENFYFDLEKTNGTQEFMLILYSFMKNSDIKKFLEEKQLSTSLVPEESEYTASAFQKSAFNYVTKFDI